MNKSILIISYYFPPIKAIGGIRTYNFTKYLSIKGWETTVFTTSTWKFLDNESFFSKLKNTKYVYIPSFDLQVIRKIFKSGKTTNKSTASNNFDNDISKTSFMQKIRNSFPFNISYEGGFIYIVFGVIYGLYYVKRHKIKYIYSTFSPNANHIVAYIIKILSPNIYWVADFRDLPYGDSEAKLFMKNFHLSLNKKIYTKSDAIITVSEGLKNTICKYNNNIHVINNGVDLNIKEFIHTENKTNFFNIVYTGSLYAGKRDAELLFKVVHKLKNSKNLQNIRLIYAGRDGNIWKYWSEKYNLQENVIIHSLLNTEEVKKIQSGASINLMLTWSTKKEKGILTGKFYEYLSYSKPIICMVNGDKDNEIEEKFTKLNCGLVVYSDEKKLSQYIEDYFQQWQQSKFVSISYNKYELEKYTSKYLTNELENILLKADR